MTDRTSVDKVTRIVAVDEGIDYDNVAIFLHWTTALLVLFQFVSAEVWDWLARPTQKTMQSLHVSFGLLLTAVIVARIIWQLIPGHRRSAIISGWMKTASTSWRKLPL